MSFQGLLGVVKTVGIIKELMEIWLNEVCDTVAFISKSLSDTERNYKIHNKEMLAVVRCLEAWGHFLEGATEKFEIWTDHKNLKYFMKAQKLN